MHMRRKRIIFANNVIFFPHLVPQLCNQLLLIDRLHHLRLIVVFGLPVHRAELLCVAVAHRVALHAASHLHLDPKRLVADLRIGSEVTFPWGTTLPFKQWFSILRTSFRLMIALVT